jgi:hypothetical protein
MASEAEQWKNLPQEHMARSTKLPWYTQSFEHKLTPSFRALLEGWSGIAPKDVIGHIYQSVSDIRYYIYLPLTQRDSAKSPGRSSLGHV